MKTFQKVLLVAVSAVFLTTQAKAIMYFARPYDPNLQRWLTRDPLGDVERENLIWPMRANSAFHVSKIPPFEAVDRPNPYIYVHNTPIDLIDALGYAPRIHIDWKAPDPPSLPDVDKNLLKSAWKNLQDCANNSTPEDDCADICGMLTSVYPGQLNDAGCLSGCLTAFHTRCDKKPKPSCPTK